MKRMVRYKLKPDRVAENEALVRGVYDELRRRSPPGVRYATFRLDDGLSFVHVIGHETAEASNALSSLPSFKAFVAAIRERCEEAPVTTEMQEIGSHGLFAD